MQTQRLNMGDCGIACMSMIHQYYHGAHDYDAYASGVTMVKTGSEDDLGMMMPGIGAYLLDDYDARMVFANPQLFADSDLGAGMDRVRDALDEKTVKTTKPNDIEALKSFTAFSGKGGQVEVAIPTLDHIRAEIDQGRPLIALGTSRFLYGLRGMNFHFTVVTGYDDEYIYINNPGLLPDGTPTGKGRHPIDQWFYCLYSSGYADMDNASLLMLTPKGTKNGTV